VTTLPEQLSHLDADQRDDREQRVAKRVLVQHGVVGQASGARRADVVLMDRFQHGRPRHPHGGRGQGRAERDRGQDQMPEPLGDVVDEQHTARGGEER